MLYKYLKKNNSRDVNDSRLFVVQKPNAKAFQQSLYELNLFNDEHRHDIVKKFLNQVSYLVKILRSHMSICQKIIDMFL